MSGRKVADRPDPEWVATLKEGDRVVVALNSAEVAEAVVQYVGGFTSGYLNVRPGGLFRITSGYEQTPRMGGSRYLVPVASSPDSEGGAT